MRGLVGKRMIVSKQDMMILAERTSSMEKKGRSMECVLQEGERILKPFGDFQLQNFSQAFARAPYLVSYLPNPVSQSACVCQCLSSNIDVPTG
jgi:hypothetical protein